MSANLLYDIANYYVVPFWLLLVLLPNWSLTRWIMKTLILFLPLILLFLYFLSQALTPESATNLLFAPLDNVVNFFSGKEAVASAWMQFLTFDLFVARWIYWQGQEKGIFTTHSIILSYFGGGGSGILSHFITVWLSQKFSPHPAKPPLSFPKAIFSVTREEFNQPLKLTLEKGKEPNQPLELTIFDVEKHQEGNLPEDLQGHVFIVGPAGTLDSPNILDNPLVVEPAKEDWVPLFNGDGMIYRLDFHRTPINHQGEPGQVCTYHEGIGQAWLASSIVKTPCYYADEALKTKPKYQDKSYEWMKFRNFGLARLSFKLGSRNSLNTAFLPMKFLGQKERLLVTWDAGRPYEINPCSLNVTAPVGWNSDWSAISTVNKFGTFEQLLTTAHPQFDPRTGEMFTVNASKSFSSLSRLTWVLYSRAYKLVDWLFENKFIKFILKPISRYLNRLLVILLRRLEKNIPFPAILGEDGVYLQRWDGKKTGLERWKIVKSDKSSPRIWQSLHQMGLTENYVILADSAFKLSIVDLLPGFKQEIAKQGKEDLKKIENFLRNFLDYPQLPYTDIYIISRKDLQSNTDTDVDPKKCKTVKAKVVRINPEIAHFLVDYDDRDGKQITLHPAHTAASDPTEFIHTEDRSVYDDPKVTPDPQQRQQATKDLKEMHGMVCNSMDVSRLGCCIIDVEKIDKKQPWVLPKSQYSFVPYKQSKEYTWSAAIYAYRDDQPTERFTDIYWTCWGGWKDMLSQFILDMYKSYNHRIVPVKELRDKIMNPGKPSNLLRLHIDRSQTIPKVTIKENYNFGDMMLGNSPQFVPRVGSSDPTDGYIVCVVIYSHNKLANNSEIWIFDAKHIDKGPRYKLRHERLNFGMTIHSTWLQELAHPPLREYNIKKDYEYLVNKTDSVAVAKLFEEEIYRHFE